MESEDESYIEQIHKVSGYILYVYGEPWLGLRDTAKELLLSTSEVKDLLESKKLHDLNVFSVACYIVFYEGEDHE